VKFEVVTAVKLRLTVFYDVMLRRWLSGS